MELVTLSVVLYVPELEDNLISIGQLEEKELKSVAYNGRQELFREEKKLFTAHRMARLYYLTTESSPSIQEIQLESVRKANKVALDVWHDRLEHPNMDTVKRLGVLSKLMEKDQ